MLGKVVLVGSFAAAGAVTAATAYADVDAHGRTASGKEFRVELRETQYEPRSDEPANDGSWWGIDEGYPSTVVSRFLIEVGGKVFRLPRTLYADLSRVKSASLQEEGESLIVRIAGSEAAGAYTATFVFREGEVERTVRSAEFPDERWETTIYHEHWPDER